MNNSETLSKSEMQILSKVKSTISELLSGLEVSNVSTQYRIGKHKVDMIIDVRGGSLKKKIVCEIKSVGEPRFIAQAILQLRNFIFSIENSYPVFIAPYISDAGKKLCIQNGVGYIDLTGNVYLRFDSVFIERSGKDIVRMEKRTLRSIFSPKSTRIVRALLIEPKRKWTLKELAEVCQVSIGQAYKVSSALQDKGYLLRDGDKLLKVEKSGDLLDALANNYDFSKNKIFTYFTYEKNPKKFMEKIGLVSRQIEQNYGLSLLSGASLVAPFVRFTDIHFYITGEPDEWVKKLELAPVEFGGTVHLIQPYDEGVLYGIQTIEGLKVVSDIQLYIDLYKYPARGREQAEFLKKERIKL